MAATLLLLLFPVVESFQVPASHRLRLPATPLDQTHALYAEQWRFLWQAREQLPPGASYTVEAADEAEQWPLFMMSLGVLTEQTALPAAYYATPLPHVAAAAEYVLDFGCHREPGGGKVTVARFVQGCLWRREPR